MKSIPKKAPSVWFQRTKWPYYTWVVRLCGACRDMLPKVEKLLTEYPKLKGAYVEVGDVPELAAAFSVFTIPALLIYAEGKEVIREARHISLLDIAQRVDRYYGLLFG